MKIVEVPGFGSVEFPDGMTDDQIAQAIRSNMSPAQSVADSTSRLEALKVSAGRGVDQLLAGLTQKYLEARGEGPALRGLAQIEDEKRAAYKPLAERYPVVTGIGESARLAAIPMGSLGVVGTALASGIPALMSYGSNEERLRGAAVDAAGGAIGAGIGQGVAKLLKPTQGVNQGAEQAARRIGYELSPGQATGNAALQNFENYLARSPGSSGAMQARQVAQQSALNRAAAQAIGQKADDLGAPVFEAANKQIGQEFTRLQGRTAPQLGGDFLNALAVVDADNLAKGSFKSPQVDTLVDKALDLAQKGGLSGKAYKEIRTELNNRAQSAFSGGDASLGQAYKAVRGALDDAAKKSLSKTDQEAWDAVRQQWQAYKLLTRSNVAEAGNVSAPRLAAGMRSGGDLFRRGGMSGPLADVATLGEALKGVQNPNSGQLLQQMVYGNPLTGLPMMAGNKALESVYNSPLMQRYLMGGLLDVPTPAARQLGAPAGAGLLGEYLGAQ